VSFPQRPAPSISGRRLTRLLTRWADAHRLDPRRAEAIRLAARAAPVDLGFDWWWRLLDPENGSVFRAPATRSGVAGASGPAIEPPFSIGTPGLTAWLSDDGDYQPYLRLT
jgi:hypothetical protein